MRPMFYSSFFLSLFLFGITHCKGATSALNPEESIEAYLEKLSEEIDEIVAVYQQEALEYNTRYVQTKKQLLLSRTIEEKVYWLIEKDKIENELNKLSLKVETDISKVRYIKGLQIIKILYEKTLALDHHFASVASIHEVNKIANPNNYPEFEQLKSSLKKGSQRKKGFDLTQILGNNIYTSVAHSLISLFNNEDATKTEKESSLKEMECILDFTLRMHTDLNTIYFETVFLQKNNENIMGELHQLFADFTKPIAYSTTLQKCRNTDDWTTIRNQLNVYMEALNLALVDEAQPQKAHHMRINLEFPIDRLLQFITQYNAFIDQGAKFYEKFGIMLQSYENEQQCANKIPIEYAKLKENIRIAIEKFNTAYKPVEINGSKMKEVLYGINEYD